MARLNISIPDGLKAEMDLIIDRVNWSAIAAEAFSREVRMRRKVDNMEIEGIVERLRASREFEQGTLREMGYKLGANWAAQRATYSLLKLIGEKDGVVEALHTGKALDGCLEDFEVNEFWEMVTGIPKVPNVAFIEGFVNGASHIWGRVSHFVQQEP